MRRHADRAPARLARLGRLIGRVIHPTGMVIVVLGADGAGKTTLLAGLERELGPLFRRVIRRHLRPRVVRAGSGSGDAGNPHGRPPRGSLGSAAQALLWWLDGWLGWFTLLAPARTRAALVLFDRGLADLALDPARYRFGGPAWLARLPAALGPRPDLTLVVLAAPDQLCVRKDELDAPRAAVLDAVYRDFARRARGTVVIEAADAASALADAREAALRNLGRRWS
jgi:thymidylate kinase